MISDPAMYRLVLSVGETTVDAVIVSRVHENEVIHRRFDIPEATSALAMLRNIVNENPLLVTDFHKVDLIFGNNRFFLISHDEAEPDEIRRRTDILWPSDRSEKKYDSLADTVEDNRTDLVWTIEHDLLSYVRRIWNNPDIHHRIGVMARYYSLKNHLGNMGKIHAFIADGHTDIIAFARDGLLMANTFKTNAEGSEPSETTAAYYILAAAKNLDFDAETDRVFVGGSTALRDNTIALLRNFIPLSMPQLTDHRSPASTHPDIPAEVALILAL